MLSETHVLNSATHWKTIAVVILALTIVGASVFFYMKQQAIAPALPPTSASDVPAAATPVAPTEESLGGTLYEKANNPLGDKLPEQVPVANPISDAYKNPF
jgi:hypothetical protein